MGCPPAGCLFNIRDDPTEHNEIGALYPDKLKELQDRLAELKASSFQTNWTDPSFDDCSTVKDTIAANDGFAAPVCVKG